MAVLVTMELEYFYMSSSWSSGHLWLQSRTSCSWSPTDVC